MATHYHMMVGGLAGNLCPITALVNASNQMSLHEDDWDLIALITHGELFRIGRDSYCLLSTIYAFQKMLAKHFIWINWLLWCHLTEHDQILYTVQTLTEIILSDDLSHARNPRWLWLSYRICKSICYCFANKTVFVPELYYNPSFKLSSWCRVFRKYKLLE